MELLTKHEWAYVRKNTPEWPHKVEVSKGLIEQGRVITRGRGGLAQPDEVTFKMGIPESIYHTKSETAL